MVGRNLMFSPTFATIIVFVTIITNVYGWGAIGHRLVARLAQSQLTSEAFDWVKFLVPWYLSGNLTAVAIWADDILYPDTNQFAFPNWQWSRTLHYINTKSWTCNYVPSTDCIDDFCVEGALKNYSRRVIDTNLGDVQHQEALMFLVHFVGDIHQPLHVGFDTDRGGNSVRGNFMNQTFLTNLHSLWDSGLIDIRLSRDFNANIVKYYEYIHTIMLHQTHTDGNDNFNKWVNESLAAVCQHVYFDEGNAPMNASMNFTLGNIYYERNIGIVEQRLAQGGRRGNTVTEQMIDEFEKTYKSDKAIWWYSRNCFLYRIINGALRQKKLEVILYFRFFLMDVCRQLQSAQAQYLEYFEDNPILKVYRGQLMTREEIIYLEKFTGFTYSINSFFSTTRQRSTALMFSGVTDATALRTDGCISVLFEIEADIRLKRKPFAYIGHLSYFGSGEEEVLFMVGAMFRLTSTEYNKRQKKSPYTDHEALSTISIESQFINVGYLIQRSYLHENYSVKYYEQLLHDFRTDYKNTCACFVSLGWIACENDKYDLAFQYQTTALQLYEQTQLSSADLLINIYNCLGTVYRKRNDYNLALEFYSKAEEYSSSSCINHCWINFDQFRNVSSIHMASIYKLQQQFDLAWKMYQKIIEKLTDDNLHKLVFQYILKAYNDSVENRKHFLDYTMKYLPSHYEILVYSYVHIVELAILDKNHDFAIDCLKRLLEVEWKSDKYIANQKQWYYSNTPLLYKRIGCLYEEKGDLDSVIEWFEKAFDTSTVLSLFISHTYLITARDIALIHAKKGGENITLAIEWHKKFIEMLLKDEHNERTYAMELANCRIVVYDIENELWQKSFLQTRVSHSKLGWNEVEVRGFNDGSRTYNNMIALSYYDIGNLFERSDQGIEYYKKSVLFYLRNELEFLLRHIESINLKEIERYFNTERKLDIKYRNDHYLNEDTPIFWKTLQRQNVNGDCLTLIRTDGSTDPPSVIVTVRTKLELFPESDDVRLKKYDDLYYSIKLINSQKDESSDSDDYDESLVGDHKSKKQKKIHALYSMCTIEQFRKNMKIHDFEKQRFTRTLRRQSW
ncbi:unnamed protein product [Rotaria magnacalcarata]